MLAPRAGLEHCLHGWLYSIIRGATKPDSKKAQRLELAMKIPSKTFSEYAKFDSALCQQIIGLGGLAATTALRMSGRGAKALELETTLHRNAFSEFTNKIVERRVRKSIAQKESPLEGYVQSLVPQGSTQTLFDDPARLLGQRILVIKSASPTEKGVLLLDYSFVFSLFARSFDVEKITERYHLVLEPSWSGTCDRDVLALAGKRFPVFVQSNEPRDIEFLQRLDSNLIPLAIAANWWIDNRIFTPLRDVAKDADVFMNAAWAQFKRHDAFFNALAKLRNSGKKLRVILVGYGMDMSRADITGLAHSKGISDQIEFHEKLQPTQVNEQLNRAKVNVIWSRREGSNRAFIEGMCADVPGILREGFNYGHQYPYVNSTTGCFASETDLPRQLVDMTANPERYRPREWVMGNMTPQIATDIIDQCIEQYSRDHNERWTTGQLTVKVTSLNSMAYWDATDRARFTADYDFLRSMLRHQPIRGAVQDNPANLTAS